MLKLAILFLFNLIPRISALTETENCKSIDSQFFNATLEQNEQSPCRCFQNSQHVKFLNLKETAKSLNDESIWIGCSGQSMPAVFRALSSLNNTSVSLLVIWDSLLNILPADMFAKVSPISLIIESSAVSVFRKGAFNRIGKNLKKLTLSKNILKSIDQLMFLDIPRLELLDISENKITTISVGTFDSLTHLTTLILSGNQIQKIADTSFNNLKEIKFLDLSRNKLTKISGETFKNLDNLDTLYLHDNNIMEIDEKSFENLKNLQVLNLGNNVLSKISLKNLPNLRKLYLSDNNFADLSNIQLRNLPSLEILSLNHNSIRVIRNKSFVGLSNSRKLKSLSLVHNSISKIESRAFENMTSLITLSLQNNTIINLKEKHSDSPFKNLNALQNLFLSNNEIVTITDEFTNLKNLQVLALDHNKIHKIDANAFSGINLRKIFLNKNKLYYLPINVFASIDFKKLQAADLSDNKWECIIGQEWLGDWLKESGSLSTSIGSLGCLSTLNSTQRESVLEEGNAAWIYYLSTFLALITIIFMFLIGYMIYQQLQQNQLIFGGLRRFPSDMVNLIPDNLSFPNSIVGSFSPILKPASSIKSKNTEKIVLEPESNEKKRVRFSETN